MFVDEKTKELVNAIKTSDEYLAYEKAKDDLHQFPDQLAALEEYKELLFESQLEQFLGGGFNQNKAKKMDVLYREMSKYDKVNAYLMAEYEIKQLLGNIYKDLTHIVDSNDRGLKEIYFS